MTTKTAKSEQSNTEQESIKPQSGYILGSDGYYFLPEHAEKVNTDLAKRNQRASELRANRYWNMVNRVYMQIGNDGKYPVFLEVTRHNRNSELYTTVSKKHGKGQLFTIRAIQWTETRVKQGNEIIVRKGYTRVSVGYYNVFVPDTDKTQAFCYTDSGTFYTIRPKRDNVHFARMSVSIVQDAAKLARQIGTFNGKQFTLGKDKTPFKENWQSGEIELQPLTIELS